MLLRSSVVILLALPGCTNHPIPIPVTNAAFADHTDLAREQTLMLDMGHGIRVPAIISVTTKGNGTLRVLNIAPRIVDQHDDGDVYEGGSLDLRLVDVNGDGYRDLVAYGACVSTPDDPGKEPRRRRVAMLFLFDPDSRSFTAFGTD